MAGRQDYRLPSRYCDGEDDKVLAAAARLSLSPHREERKSTLAQISSVVLWLATFSWLPSSPRQRRHLCVLLLLMSTILGFWVLISDDSRRHLVTVDGASESLSRLWSHPDSSSSCSSPASPAAPVSAGSLETSISPDIPDYDPFSTGRIADTSVSTRLPQIPPKIWQVYLSWASSAVTPGYLASWMSRSPSFMYTILDADGARDVVGRLSRLALDKTLRLPIWVPASAPSQEKDAKSEDSESKSESERRGTDDIDSVSAADIGSDALQLYEAMPRRVLRADFLRYLLLALEGGIYTDSDTSLVRPIRDWVPESMRNATRLIVGLEADSSPPVSGTKYEVQFCQWTLASGPNHPTMWTMVHRILAHMRDSSSGFFTPSFTDDDVLAVTGPAAWTEVIYAHLNRVAGDGAGQERITWETLHGMTEPRLFGDTVVLPIDSFATGVPHSKASKQTVEATLVKHQFLGKWRGNNGK
ncbi:initiation-specific alpha-mannosyltransferase [Grosmannia clavigera kw1407]|uniref:Initiation-specific alpha-mannosyltransferase n=1 Tax=Grosmannia clavigera (strain kw1407 / UAMH 11150) TaxID=655863 RepID=F0X8C5_GROCL|nr:initiation-specific alpha-mannosyltransferase [Grosmannia clavigera kw1407]EFX05282.1 initiation-specific alpha-mannosyltransferase [Grosmannia clavigera kw1407]